jgi:ferritin-like metal-binding protein YciE
MAEEKDLEDAFYETLKDVYFAEKQALKACKKSAKKAQSPELRDAFEEHAEETANQIERLKEIFEMLGKAARAKTCEAMQGIMSEMEEDLDEFGGTSANDAVIIGCGQAIEHYEIARYGMLKTWAMELGEREIARLLDQTLREEKNADALLSQIAKEISNRQAKSRGSERSVRGHSASFSDEDGDDDYRSSRHSHSRGQVRDPAHDGRLRQNRNR